MRAECAKLYAHMFGGLRAAYVASTAFAWHRMSDNANHGHVEQFRKAQVDVENQLRNPRPDWEPPNDDAVCYFAAQVKHRLGNAIWLDLSPRGG